VIAGVETHHLHAVGRDDRDPTRAAAAVAWSVIAEPGDAVAGYMVDTLGPDTALDLVLGATDAAAVLRVADACRSRVPTVDEDHQRLVSALVPAFARWRPRLPHLDVVRVLRAAAAIGARLTLPGDTTWPAGLADLGPHAPLALWIRGVGRGGTSDAVGVVGSRASTPYGSEMAAEVTSAAADAGAGIVSGGAYGIDAVAHRVALAAGVPTVAVLAGGVDQLYPAGNRDLLHAVMRAGAVVAESPPGVRPTRWRFLHQKRNVTLRGCRRGTETGAGSRRSHWYRRSSRG
jgi:DNA processing protein